MRLDNILPSSTTRQCIVSNQSHRDGNTFHHVHFPFSIFLQKNYKAILNSKQYDRSFNFYNVMNQSSNHSFHHRYILTSYIKPAPSVKSISFFHIQVKQIHRKFTYIQKWIFYLPNGVQKQQT